MIRVEDVTHLYPDRTRALDGVNLEVEGGSSLGLVGPNGGGKSTLLWHLNGLLAATTGRVSIDGVDLAGRRVADIARAVGLAFQECDDQLFQTTVELEVRAGAESDEAAAEALELVGLDDRKHEHPSNLGYSRRKLLAMAAVVAMGTAVVALDEPTTGQDAAGRDRVVAVLRQLRTRGRTVIVAGHDRALISSELGRSVTLRQGRIVPL